MQTEILIIGQGISGTMLSWFLYQANIPFIILDAPKANAPSKVAAGIINPVTGRRIVKTWMIDTLMPFAVTTYEQMGKALNQQYITQKNIIDFFPSQQIQTAFEERVLEKDGYLNLSKTEPDFNNNFHYHFGYGIITPSYIVDINMLLKDWSMFLKRKEIILEEVFDCNALEVTPTGIRYQNIQAREIIFADGIASAQNSWFKNLPFAPNKGEALLIEVKDLDRNFIYKKGVTVVPVQENKFWVGANYLWDYEDELPTKKFYTETKIALENWLKTDFTIMDHLAAVRPANIERRPFVGFHPNLKNVGILNGMGAKGTSLAPFFANALVQNILHQTPILPEADITRFSKILNRP